MTIHRLFLQTSVSNGTECNERTIKKELVVAKINIDSSTQIKILLERIGVPIESTSEGMLSQFVINNKEHIANKFITLLIEYRE